MYDAGAICLVLSSVGGYTEHLASAVRSFNKAAHGGPSDIAVAGVLLAQAEYSKANSRSKNAHKWENVLRLSWKSWPAGTPSHHITHLSPYISMYSGLFVIPSDAPSQNISKFDVTTDFGFFDCVFTEDRPAELYYQMGLLADQFKDTSQAGMHAPESLRSKRSWMQRAVHTNPTCFRYWAAVH